MGTYTPKTFMLASMVVKSMSFGNKPTWFKSQLCCFPAVETNWASQLTPLCLRMLTWKMGIIAPTLQRWTDIKWANLCKWLPPCLAHCKHSLQAIISIINMENEWEEMHQNANGGWYLFEWEDSRAFKFSALYSSSFFKVSIVKYYRIRRKKLSWKRTSDFLFLFYLFIFFFAFLGPYPWYMEVPRLGVELELQLSAYTTAAAMCDLSCICDLHHSSRQCRILNQWVRPGIKPKSSRILVRCVFAAPQQELLLWLIAFATGSSEQGRKEATHGAESKQYFHSF